MLNLAWNRTPSGSHAFRRPLSELPSFLPATLKPNEAPVVLVAIAEMLERRASAAPQNDESDRLRCIAEELRNRAQERAKSSKSAA